LNFTCAGVVTNLVGYGPAIAEHVVLDAGLQPSMLLRQGVGAAEGTAAAGKKGKKGGASAAAAAAAAGSKGGVADKGKGKGAENGEEENDAEDEAGKAHADAGAEANAGQGQHAGTDGSTASPPPAVRPPLTITPEQLQAVYEALQRLDAWFAGLETAPPIGVISCLPPKGVAGKGRHQKAAVQQDGDSTTAKQQSDLVYNDFNPLVMAQLTGAVNLEFPTFDAALEEFFSKVSST
jgi:hypothetical protein